jgi:hypothetical protein
VCFHGCRLFVGCLINFLANLIIEPGRAEPAKEKINHESTKDPG